MVKPNEPGTKVESDSSTDELVLSVERVRRPTPKHDMRGIGFGDNGEGNEGDGGR